MTLVTLTCRTKDGQTCTVVAKGYDPATTHFAWAWATNYNFFGEGYKKGHIVADDCLCFYTTTIVIRCWTGIRGEKAEEIKAMPVEVFKSAVPDMYQKFGCYLRELLQQYHQTGKLTGIAAIAKKWKCTPLSIQQFYELGVNNFTTKELTTDVIKSLRDEIAAQNKLRKSK